VVEIKITHDYGVAIAIEFDEFQLGIKELFLI
jgi:hypothetical protein